MADAKVAPKMRFDKTLGKWVLDLSKEGGLQEYKPKTIEEIKAMVAAQAKKKEVPLAPPKEKSLAEMSADAKRKREAAEFAAKYDAKKKKESK